MSLIKPKSEQKMEEVTIKIEADLHQEISKYCTTFDINDLTHFFAEAARFVLKKDKAWTELNKKSKAITA